MWKYIYVRLFMRLIRLIKNNNHHFLTYPLLHFEKLIPFTLVLLFDVKLNEKVFKNFKFLFERKYIK